MVDCLKMPSLSAGKASASLYINGPTGLSNILNKQNGANDRKAIIGTVFNSMRLFSLCGIAAESEWTA
jgi:hypothetical protein